MIHQLLIIGLAFAGLILARQDLKSESKAYLRLAMICFAMACVVACWVIYWEVYTRTGSPIKEWILETFFEGRRIW